MKSNTHSGNVNCLANPIYRCNALSVHCVLCRGQGVTPIFFHFHRQHYTKQSSKVYVQHPSLENAFYMFLGHLSLNLVIQI